LITTLNCGMVVQQVRNLGDSDIIWLRVLVLIIGIPLALVLLVLLGYLVFNRRHERVFTDFTSMENDEEFEMETFA